MSVEQFKTTTHIMNNELAKLTWARKTWEQRVQFHVLIHVNRTGNIHVTNYIVSPINALFRRPIKVVTLSQMQF